MSVQRRRGEDAFVLRSRATIDRRGNTTYRATGQDRIAVRAAFFPDRSARAEVPGQQQINVYKMLTAPLPGEDVTLWSRVIWRDKTWDIVTPPAEREKGARRTRHWTMAIRERPSRGED